MAYLIIYLVVNIVKEYLREGMGVWFRIAKQFDFAGRSIRGFNLGRHRSKMEQFLEITVFLVYPY